MVMPLIAFAPLISGVCSVGGTLEISSKPRKIAITRTVTEAISAGAETLGNAVDAARMGWRGGMGSGERRLDAFVGDFALVADERTGDDLSLIHI